MGKGKGDDVERGNEIVVDGLISQNCGFTTAEARACASCRRVVVAEG